jgi:hypothetical protein
MIDKNNKQNKRAVADLNLLIDSEIDYVKEFNKEYESFCNSNDEERINFGVKAAFIIVDKFDFNEEVIKNKKGELITFARDILYEASSKPHFNPEAMMYLIRALYGQTNIAYSHEGEHKKVNIEDGNEWVQFLERNTNNRTLKAYALTLRVYQFIVNNDIFEMEIADILKKAERDLIYATKWDEENYLAFFALGLLYLDPENSKYDLEKSIENFEKCLEFENNTTFLDKYLSQTEKIHFMTNAKKQIEILKSKI